MHLCILKYTFSYILFYYYFKREEDLVTIMLEAWIWISQQVKLQNEWSIFFKVSSCCIALHKENTWKWKNIYCQQSPDTSVAKNHLISQTIPKRLMYSCMSMRNLWNDPRLYSVPTQRLFSVLSDCLTLWIQVAKYSSHVTSMIKRSRPYFYMASSWGTAAEWKLWVCMCVWGAWRRAMRGKVEP